MARRPPSRSGLLITTGLVMGFTVWTILVLRTWTIPSLDRQLLAPPVDPLSSLGQILTTVALVTYPWLLYGALLGLALWAVRHRLRNVAAALVLTVLLAGGGAALLRRVVGRARPEQAMESITVTSFAYPSGHVTAAVAAAVMVGAVMTVTRRSKWTRRWWTIGSAALVLVVALDRWVMSAHWMSDIIGGALLGGASAAVALVAADVHVLPHRWQDLLWVDSRPAPPEPTGPRCAVIFNPIKVTNWVTFRRHVEYELQRRGYSRTLWLETTPDDPGRAMTEVAVRKGVDLVLGAGGDGTIRVVSSGLAGTGIPFGLIPAGTGNLLARNLGIPLDEADALDVAFDGDTRRIDLVKITVDEHEPTHFAVMAGIGIDAAILGNTDVSLKKAVGSAAYFVSAAQHVNHPPVTVRISVDGERQPTQDFLVLVVGNVGFLQGGIPLIPDAKVDDGLLDLLAAAPRTWRDKVTLTAKVIARRDRSSDQLQRHTARKVVMHLDEPREYQLDGDAAGEAQHVVFEIDHHALTIRVPRSDQPAELAR
ncbi:diacylglycerol kinase family protein [Microlunatus sp. Y2014]|uniref:diacylglycerol kinase family protein n=1 Tax=Microlunatus sp. Y2014 TaxID=3418488 RepID=UPI003DA718C7